MRATSLFDGRGIFAFERGSDWPVCNTGMGLPRWIETTRALLASLSEHERARIARLNALRFYRLDGPLPGTRTQ